MDYRIEELGEFRVVGLVQKTTMENGACYQQVPAFWGEVMQSDKHMRVLALMNRPPMGLIGVSVYNTDPTDAKKFDAYIACSTDKPVPDGMVEYTVPAATWAVFPCMRNEISQVEASIVSQWQHTSAYQVLNAGYETGDMVSHMPDLEVYGQADDVEVWVAVKKKQE